jgi:hypothetical protein
LVPHGYDVDPSFAEWIHRQRTAYASMIKDEKPNPLLQSRMKKLEEIGFNFTVHTDKWMDQYRLLKIYKEKHGHCHVPRHYTENPKLSRWTHTQRHQRRLNLKLYKQATISQERIALLDEIGFNWELRPSREQPRATWNQRYDELVDYYKTYNNFYIPIDTHPKLHRWCCEQRNRLQDVHKQSLSTCSNSDDIVETKEKVQIGLDRIKLLHDIGFTKDTILTKPIHLPIDETNKFLPTEIRDEQKGIRHTQQSTMVEMDAHHSNAASSQTLSDVPLQQDGMDKEVITNNISSTINHTYDENVAAV